MAAYLRILHFGSNSFFPSLWTVTLSPRPTRFLHWCRHRSFRMVKKSLSWYFQIFIREQEKHCVTMLEYFLFWVFIFPITNSHQCSVCLDWLFAVWPRHFKSCECNIDLCSHLYCTALLLSDLLLCLLLFFLLHMIVFIEQREHVGRYFHDSTIGHCQNTEGCCSTFFLLSTNGMKI